MTDDASDDFSDAAADIEVVLGGAPNSSVWCIFGAPATAADGNGGLDNGRVGQPSAWVCAGGGALDSNRLISKPGMSWRAGQRFF